MLLVSQIFSEVQRVMGQCDDASVFNRVSDAAEILCNKADIDPLLGWVDIITSGNKFVTLPREVDTVLSLNISGHPSFPRDRWAEFHLNGRGSDVSDSCVFFWDDKGNYPLFADPVVPVHLSLQTSTADRDASAELWAYGYDENDLRITTNFNGTRVEGFRVPALIPGVFTSSASVTGAGTAVVNGLMYRDPVDDNGKAEFLKTPENYLSPGIFWTGSEWQIVVGSTVHYKSTDDVEFPWQVTTWTADEGEEPLPTVVEAPYPLFKRVTEIRKSSSQGFFKLYGTPVGGASTLLGEYEPSETLPQFRRITLSNTACWVRIQYRRKVFRVTSLTDRVPVHSRYALMLMCKALQKYDDDKIEEGQAYEEKAVKLLLEKQYATNPPVTPSLQVSPHTTLLSPQDRMQ